MFCFTSFKEECFLLNESTLDSNKVLLRGVYFLDSSPLLVELICWVKLSKIWFSWVKSVVKLANEFS